MDNFTSQPEGHDLAPQTSQDDIAALPTALQRVAQLYAAQPVPRPTAEATQRLMERLLYEETASVRADLPWRPSRIQILRIARWQMHLLGPSFWVTSVLLLVAGFLLFPIFGGETLVNLLIILLPLTAVLSVIHAVGRLSLHVHEIEASCPTNIIETTTALALAIVCFNILLGLIATLALSLINWAPFVTLLAIWLGPLLLLASISLPVALRWGTWPAFLIGGVPWLFLIVTSITSQLFGSEHVSLLNYGSTSLLLSWLSALLGLGVLLVLFLRGSRLQHHLLQQS